ncbi:zinc finger CCCH domain-containing protein 3 [Anticarsia gemmatalis]|uniref:zinc finger CCCH domain-containing protein 3 n=1 Tax=Anticarsia gemmatalis TaxID=129554 RepID=UPI003F75BF73
MASYNNFVRMLEDSVVDQTKNKVYVNPNFNKPQGSKYSSSAVMHVNPKFSHLLSNVQSNAHNKPRIYVNPNFVKTNSYPDEMQIPTHNDNYFLQNTVVNQSNAYSCEDSTTETEKNQLTVPFANSRYSLVRQSTSQVTRQVPQEAVIGQVKNTIQINKYKSIPLKDIKKNLDNVKKLNKYPSIDSARSNNRVTSNKICVSSSTFSRSRLIYRNSGAKVAVDKSKIRSSIDSPGKPVLNQLRGKIKGNFKKNNIPCPLFRKFGRCLRKSRGKCEFLHDKKHVSICRKFLKGLCHDKDCLLSHDLTTKKMPTCYFYLQGNCTKSDCPYLHVKLSETVKICPDFLKGYCEKGSKCSQRHVMQNEERKGTLKRSSLTSKRNYNKVQNKTVICGDHKEKEKNTSSAPTDNNDKSDHRYYQENANDLNETETCDIIKPTRCKLGTLPSFIQL